MNVYSILVSSLIFSLGSFTASSAHRRGCGQYRRCGSSSISARTDARAAGGWTDTFGHSSVGQALCGFGGCAKVRHGAQGIGTGSTSAGSSGDIEVNGPFRRERMGSSATADAFGRRNSFSLTQGGADYSNGQGHTGASGTARGSGFGRSRARTSATANRFKRHALYLQPCTYHGTYYQECPEEIDVGTLSSIRNNQPLHTGGTLDFFPNDIHEQGGLYPSSSSRSSAESGRSSAQASASGPGARTSAHVTSHGSMGNQPMPRPNFHVVPQYRREPVRPRRPKLGCRSSVPPPPPAWVRSAPLVPYFRMPGVQHILC